MKRRDFIKKGSAVVATTVVASSSLVSCGGGNDNPTNTNTTPGSSNNPANQPVESVAGRLIKTLYITEGSIAQADARGSVNVYFRGFSASANEINVPGQALIATLGDSVELTIINTLSTAHRFLIEGITGADSGTIAPGATVNVNFTVNTPGTYMYYDPTFNNRLVGLHGGFAVMPNATTNTNTNELYAGSRTYVKQHFWIFNDVDPAWNTAIQNNTSVPTRFVPRYFTLNGLSGKPPGDQDSGNAALDSMADPRTKLLGKLGDRTLIRAINAGMAKHSMHIHANHMEWLSRDGQFLTEVWEKDVVALTANGGIVDVIYPFAPPPDAVPAFTQQTILQAEAQGRHIAYPMHLHDEMTQTANGGSYMFGSVTDIYYKS